jgi:hypothetical protein
MPQVTIRRPFRKLHLCDQFGSDGNNRHLGLINGEIRFNRADRIQKVLRGLKLADFRTFRLQWHDRLAEQSLKSPVFLRPEGGDGLRKNYRMAGVTGMNTVNSDKDVWIRRK